MRNDFIVENCDEHCNEVEGEIDSSDEKMSKRLKLNEDEKLQKCRERNRIHARNTRERKRAQMDLLQLRIQELSKEKRQLEDFEPESSVASILMSLSNCSRIEDTAPTTEMTDTKSYLPDNSSQTYLSSEALVERLRYQISATLSDDDDFELNPELLIKDKASCSTSELETIRRERNRMHAKKTRLRKKKMLNEMETIIANLEADIRQLKQKHNLTPEQFPSCVDQLPSAGGTSRALGLSKFTGFRHMQVKSSGSSATKASLNCTTTMQSTGRVSMQSTGRVSTKANLQHLQQQQPPIMNTVSNDSNPDANSPASSTDLYPSSLPSGFPPLLSGSSGRLHFPVSMGDTGMDYTSCTTSSSSSSFNSNSTMTGSGHSSSNGSITSQFSPFPSCADLAQRLAFAPYPEGLLPASAVMGNAQLSREKLNNINNSTHSYIPAAVAGGGVSENSSKDVYTHRYFN